MNAKPVPNSDRKTERLRAALRENLKRRKDQARERSSPLTDKATPSTSAHESARIGADKQKS
jgi:hypothetical protein